MLKDRIKYSRRSLALHGLSLDQVNIVKKIYSRRRLESRVCKFRINVKNRLVLIAQAYTHTKV